MRKTLYQWTCLKHKNSEQTLHRADTFYFTIPDLNF